MIIVFIVLRTFKSFIADLSLNKFNITRLHKHLTQESLKTIILKNAKKFRK